MCHIIICVNLCTHCAAHAWGLSVHRCPQAVYLSKNSLRSLAGLQQFRAVRSLSLADNLLASWEALWPLVTLGGEWERRGEPAQLQQQQQAAGDEAFAALEVQGPPTVPVNVPMQVG